MQYIGSNLARLIFTFIHPKERVTLMITSKFWNSRGKENASFPRHYLDMMPTFRLSWGHPVMRQSHVGKIKISSYLTTPHILMLLDPPSGQDGLWIDGCCRFYDYSETFSWTTTDFDGEKSFSKPLKKWSNYLTTHSTLGRLPLYLFIVKNHQGKALESYYMDIFKRLFPRAVILFHLVTANRIQYFPNPVPNHLQSWHLGEMRREPNELDMSSPVP